MARSKSVRRTPAPEGLWPTAREAAGSVLFSGLRVGPLRLAQRTWVPALVPRRVTVSGEVNPAVLGWYRRLAEGRPGVIVVEAAAVQPTSGVAVLRADREGFVPGLAQIVAAIQAGSGGQTRALVQLVDCLPSRPRATPERFFYRFFAVHDGHRERLALALDEPAWLQAPEAAVRARLAIAPPSLVGRVLAVRELRELHAGVQETVSDTHLPHVAALPEVLPACFAAAAERVARAGFEGVELQLAGEWTLAGFLSPQNRRMDGFGGDLAGRLRLPLAVFAAVQGAVGEACAVGVRFQGDERRFEGAVEEVVGGALAFAQAGADFVSVSRGRRFDGVRLSPEVHTLGCAVADQSPRRFSAELHLAAAVRQAVRGAGLGAAVVAAGGIHSFAQAEGFLRAGQADLVALGRQALADPDWFEKVRRGCGDEILRCTYTHSCEALEQQGRVVTCRLWEGLAGVPRTSDGRLALAPAWAPSRRVPAPSAPPQAPPAGAHTVLCPAARAADAQRGDD